MAAKKLQYLMSPGTIGKMTLRNRIIMCPMGENLGEPDGFCGDRVQSYFEARARGGAGLVEVGSVSIAWPIGSGNNPNIAVSDDKYLPGLTRLAERVHAHGGKVALQLQHAGKNSINDTAAGRPLLLPSDPPNDGDADYGALLLPEEIAAMSEPFMREGAKVWHKVATHEDIQWVVGKFAEAADRAKRAGIDAVEIHAGHGYLISTFISPHYNKRDDEYGGSIENRSRILDEVIRAIKKKVGNDYPVWCRIEATELHVPDGIQLEHAVRTAQIAEDAGADAIHVSVNAPPTRGIGFSEGHATHIPCGFVKYAKVIKKAISIPVIVPGRIEPEEADALIGAGEIDFVGMGRKLIADPELPNKVAAGELERVRPCIYCYTCISAIFVRESVRCAVNPATGREADFGIVPVKSAKHVLIVGGGPAGMEAARVASLRGHRVTLCEKENRLGGTAIFASYAYEPNGQLVTYLEGQVRALPIDIQLETLVTPEYIKTLAPDEIVVATGAKRELPAIPGAEQSHVFSGDDLRNMMTGKGTGAKEKLSLTQRAIIGAGALVGATEKAEQVRRMSKLWMPVGKRVVIVGGGLVGLELAEFLVERDREVTVVEESPQLGKEFPIVRRFRAVHVARELGVHLLTSMTVSRIHKSEVECKNSNGETKRIPADSVIIAVGAVANHELADSLATIGIPVHIIGDADGISYIEGAMYGGATIARSI